MALTLLPNRFFSKPSSGGADDPKLCVTPGEARSRVRQFGTCRVMRAASERLTCMRYELEFQDTFEDEVLDRDRWLPYYLPHWSSRERAGARYAIGGGCLRLLIDAEQQPWCPEYDGGVRVSSLQTGAFAGPVDSVVGQHRFNPAARVREAQSSSRLYTPQYARLELRAKAERRPARDGRVLDDRL